MSPRLRRRALSASLLMASCQAAAAPPWLDIDFEAASLEKSGVRLTGVSASAQLDAAGQGQVLARAATISRPSVPVPSIEALSLACPGLSLDLARPAVRCADAALEVRVGGHAVRGNGPLALADGIAEAREYHLHLPAGQVAISGHAGPAARWVIQAPSLSIAGLWPLFAPLLDARYSDPGGAVSLGAVVHREPGHWQLEVGVGLQAVSLLGTSVAEDVGGRVSLHLDLAPTQWHAELLLGLDAGLAYIEPGLRRGNVRPGFAFEFQPQPLELRASADWTRPTGELVAEGRIFQRNVLHAAAAIEGLAPGTGFQPSRVSLSLDDGKVENLYRNILQPLLLGTAADDMELAGRLGGSLLWQDGVVESAVLRLGELYAYDNRERFRLAGLNGDLRFSAGPAPVNSAFRWEGLGVYRLNFGAGEVELVSQDSRVDSVRWSDIGFVDGTIRVDRLALGLAAGQVSLDLAGELTPVSVLALTQQLDWPLMKGTLAGHLEGLSYRDGDVRLDGDLTVRMFDGAVIIRELSLQNLFGTVPVFRTSLDVEDIDLELLTGTFAFGRIEGRLGGYIRDLELQAWQPVSFEALLATPEDDDSRHRISQRAVNNLGAIGGGMGGALSSGVTRFFQEYSYDRLGLSCRLYNGVCELGGVAEDERGFVILSRGGLLPPWIEVRGTGRSITWDALVEGIAQIASGDVVVE